MLVRFPDWQVGRGTWLGRCGFSLQVDLLCSDARIDFVNELFSSLAVQFQSMVTTSAVSCLWFLKQGCGCVTVLSLARSNWWKLGGCHGRRTQPLHFRGAWILDCPLTGSYSVNDMHWHWKHTVEKSKCKGGKLDWPLLLFFLLIFFTLLLRSAIKSDSLSLCFPRWQQQASNLK